VDVFIARVSFPSHCFASSFLLFIIFWRFGLVVWRLAEPPAVVPRVLCLVTDTMPHQVSQQDPLSKSRRMERRFLALGHGIV
jgi:hypothetical protein